MFSPNEESQAIILRHYGRWHEIEAGCVFIDFLAGSLLAGQHLKYVIVQYIISYCIILHYAVRFSMTSSPGVHEVGSARIQLGWSLRHLRFLA